MTANTPDSDERTGDDPKSLESIVDLDTSIADLASESIFVFDLNGNIRYCNPASEALYGWPSLAMLGCNEMHFATDENSSQQYWAMLLQEGRWEGTIQRRTASGADIMVAARQTVRCDADGKPRDIVEFGSRIQADLDASLSIANHPNRFTTACWDLDLSQAWPLLKSAPGLGFKDTPLDELKQWANELLARVFVVDVNERTVRLVGGYAGREHMIGRPVSLYWPLDSRVALAEVILEAASSDKVGGTWQRQLTSDRILRNPVLTIWRTHVPERRDRVYVAVGGNADDDRSFWYLRASEERYRKLMYHMPIAMWQTDASHLGRIYKDVRARGVRDFAGYLDEHPELVSYAADSVIVTEVNGAAVELFGGNNAADLLGPVGYMFAGNPETLRRVMIGRFNGQRNHEEITRIRTFDGQLLDVQMKVTGSVAKIGGSQR